MAETEFLDCARLEHLRALGGGDFVGRMIEIFLRNAPARLAAARAAQEAGDWAGLGRVVHSLVGSAGNIGAVGFHRLCREIERRAEKGPVDSIPPLLRDLEDGFGRLRPRLEEAREGSAA